jgi:hypothetical protein
MDFEKRLIEKSVKTLIDKAEECFDLAKAQEKIADKLDTVGDQLTAGAVVLKGELELDAARTSPCLRTPVETAPQESRLIPKANPK